MSTMMNEKIRVLPCGPAEVHTPNRVKDRVHPPAHNAVVIIILILFVEMLASCSGAPCQCVCNCEDCGCSSSYEYLFAFPKEKLLNVQINTSMRNPVVLEGDDAETAIDILNGFTPVATEPGEAIIGASFITINYFDTYRRFNFSWEVGHEYVYIGETYYKGQEGCFTKLKQMIDNTPLHLTQSPFSGSI